ncbi:uncharacterized protein FIBRA_04665 [Fibroporia radiculosa]|uniref:Smr domain-containing protein n=1 Tax=Fibroporia radiculosa TaxID=599839 RepID=J4HWN3_9APHY|nr:uncharacterized protein FIBRA_04665 [Fibroporia radiculosa]CCM02562.1 predicted protein [Fibroporia radiculosa]
MGLLPQPALFDTLQAEFSPPLDSSLIAAIVADYATQDASLSPSDQLLACRAVLAQLATQAEKELLDEDSFSGQLSNLHISPFSTTDETSSSADYTSTDTNTATSEVSTQYSFSSPLGFLQAAFPHVHTARLRMALSVSEQDDEGSEVDMESVVEGLLTSEYVRELEERGLDDTDFPADHGEEWSIAGKKKKFSQPAKKSKKRGTTITLVDIRQKQHEKPLSTTPQISSPDPWTQLSSTAIYISDLLPSQPATYFQSFLHSPEYPSPSKALRAALRSIVSKSKSSIAAQESNFDATDTTHLFNVLDVLHATPRFASANAEERDRLLDDTQLALHATCNQPDTALDIVQLLHELDSDSSSGQLGWGVYHSPAPPPSTASVSNNAIKTLKARLPTGPPPVQPPRSRPVSTPKRLQTLPPPTNAWQTVPRREPVGPHPLAESIPAYRRRVRGGGNGLGKGGKGDVGELSGNRSANKYPNHVSELLAQRRDALREAGRAWQRGSAKTRGGEVAMYYAERARGLQQQARDEQLHAVREMIQAKRLASNTGDTVDLHGTTVSEATQIVREILRTSGPSPVKPLTIITGRGMHSANGVGVLGPAVKAALIDDGWAVSTFDGGLVVRGRLGSGT